MQQALIDLGFLSGRADGIFGPITQSAVMAFQRANGLAVDGIAGPRTLGALYGSAPSSGDGSSGGQSSRGSTISRTLRLGDRGEDVATLQRRLNELNFNCGRADGVFGPITQSAVMAFQRANGLAVDGIVGRNTIAKLYASDVITGDLPHTSKADDIIAFAMGYIGKPYVYGASGPNSFDCSGFTSFVFKHFDVNLKRSAWDQGNDNRFAVLAQQELQKGDIVFFDTSTSTNTRYHVGIYISNGEFIHASSGGGSVRVDTLASGYYQQTFKWGLRILK
jgi:peptidoglycan hydrolase-like protein with peptidoglycan-binding domain